MSLPREIICTFVPPANRKDDMPTYICNLQKNDSIARIKSLK